MAYISHKLGLHQNSSQNARGSCNKNFRYCKHSHYSKDYRDILQSIWESINMLNIWNVYRTELLGDAPLPASSSAQTDMLCHISNVPLDMLESNTERIQTLTGCGLYIPSRRFTCQSVLIMFGPKQCPPNSFSHLLVLYVLTRLCPLFGSKLALYLQMPV